MMAFMPFRKPLGSFDRRLANQSKLMWNPVPMDLRSASPVENRAPRAREDPCSFRTRLEDDTGSEFALESTYMLDSDDIKFDDTQCISVGRSLGKFMLQTRDRDDNQDLEEGIARRLGPHLYSASTTIISHQNDQPFESAATIALGHNGSKNDEQQGGPVTIHLAHNRSVVFTPAEEHLDREMIHHKTVSEPAPTRFALRDDSDDESDMETMNMPFWHLASHPKRRSHHAGDAIPDDMSIISDVSLIPTYFPSDIMKQQRPRHRTLIKRLITTKARSARQTMRQLKRTCRDAVGHVFVEQSTTAHRPTECVRVGAIAH